MVQDKNKPLLTTTETIKYLKGRMLGRYHCSTIRYWCKERGIGVKVAGQWRVDKGKLDEFLGLEEIDG
jgi:hypothetical protein